MSNSDRDPTSLDGPTPDPRQRAGRWTGLDCGADIGCGAALRDPCAAVTER